MAENDFKPVQKPYIYDLIGQLNGAFARVTGKLSALEKVGTFEKRPRYGFTGCRKSFRPARNYHLFETLLDCEERDWAKYGRRTRQPESGGNGVLGCSRFDSPRLRKWYSRLLVFLKSLYARLHVRDPLPCLQNGRTQPFSNCFLYDVYQIFYS